MQQNLDSASGSRLQLAVAIAFVKSKRERDAECEQLRGRVGQLEADLRRVKNTTLVVANALRRNQSATHGSVSSIVLSEAKETAVAASPTGNDPSSSVLALTDNLRALLQGLHMLQLASVTTPDQVKSWAFSPPHDIVCRYLSTTLLHQPPSELRRAYLSACVKMLDTLLHKSTVSAGVQRNEDVSSSVMQMITGLVKIVTGNSNSTPHQSVPFQNIDGRNSIVDAHREFQQPAIAILAEMVQAGSSIGQLLLLACANELQSTAATLATCVEAVADKNPKKLNLHSKLCAAAILAPRCCMIMDLLASCAVRLSEWCQPYGPTCQDVTTISGPQSACVIDGSIIKATAASCAAALVLASSLNPLYTLFATGLTNAVAGLGAALQFVALDSQFAGSPCRDSCRCACHLLKVSFLPPGK